MKTNQLLLTRAGLAGLILLGLTFHATAADRVALKGHVPGIVAKMAGQGDNIPVAQSLNLALGLPLRNPAALTALLHDIYDPASPNYHHYLTPVQFTAQFGPTVQDYQAVKDFATSHGLTVTGEHSNRLLLDVSGKVADLENAFQTTLHVYPRANGKGTFYAPDLEPSVPAGVPVLDISGLDNYILPYAKYKIKPQDAAAKATPKLGSGPGGNYIGADFRAAYAPSVSLTGAGQTVGLLQFDGYLTNDITAYEIQAGLSPVTLTNVLLDGYNGAPTGNGGEVETSLDIQMVMSMAPGVSLIMVYEAGPFGIPNDMLNRMATDNVAKQIGCSWGWGGGPKTSTDQIFQQMDAQGQSFFNATGDDDAFTDDQLDSNPFYPGMPSSSPYITQVGGTTLSTSGAGGGWSGEVAWQWGNDTGSSGGISSYYVIPPWQAPISMALNQGSTSQRNVPDVSLTADNTFVIADNGVQYQGVGGTSVAAPLWAGYAALMNEQAAAHNRPVVGLINQAVYAISQSPAYAVAFRDITVGNNTNSTNPTRFFATPGYDLCTGLGSPAGSGLINLLVPPDDLVVSPALGFTSSGPGGGPFNITAQNVTLTNSGAGQISWFSAPTQSWLGVSAGNGTLQPGGPSTTVTVSLTPAAASLAPGVYNGGVFFINTTDGVSQTNLYRLIVLGPPIITNSPLSQTVGLGGSVTFTVGAFGVQPITYQWKHAGTNLPNATDASLSLVSVTTNQAGLYAVGVTNSLGGVVSSNALLTVISPPVNDSCVSAAIITTNAFTTNQSTALASSVGDPLPVCVTNSGAAVWFQFTPNTGGQATIDTSGSSFDTTLELYSGTCGSLSPITCNDDVSLSDRSSMITAGLVAGTPYYIMAGGYGGFTGNLTLHLAFTGTIGGTYISSQPASVTIPVGGKASFSITATSANPITYQWQRNGTAITGATQTTYNTNNVQLSDSGTQFTCVLTTGGIATTSAPAVMTVVGPPVNDTCAGAFAIANYNFNYSQSTTGASSSGDPVPGCITGFGNGVWFKFTPDASGTLEADTFGSDFDTGLAVYAGTCGSLTLVTCNDDSGGGALTSQIGIPVGVGTNYYFLAGGYNLHTGNLNFHMAFTLPANGGSTNNLVQNLGFEAGSFTNWTQTGNAAGEAVVGTLAYVHSGIYGAHLGPFGSLGILTQTLPTVPGQVYAISFFVANPIAGTPNEIQATWNGTPLYDALNVGAFGWTNFHFTATATSSSSVLSLGFRNDPNYFGLDDVTVIQISTPVLLGVSQNAGHVQFSWTSTSGLNYQVQFKTDLGQTNWGNLGGIIPATGSVTSALDTIGPDAARFYRITVVP